MDEVPSCYRAVLHKDHFVTRNVAHNVFAEGWNFRDWPHFNKFSALNFPRLFCYVYPLANQDRIIFPCLLFTLLLLVDDMFGELSAEEGAHIYERLYAVANGDELPSHRRAEELIMHHTWSEMREMDKSLASSFMVPYFAFMRAQLSADHLRHTSFGEYMKYRLGDADEASSSASSSASIAGQIVSSDSTPPPRPHWVNLRANTGAGFHKLVFELMSFVMDIRLTPAERAAMQPLEESLGRHMVIIGDLYGYNKETPAGLTGETGIDSEVGSAVSFLSSDTGLDHVATKRMLIRLVREYEIQSAELAAKLTMELGTGTPPKLRPELQRYVSALRFAAAGNEAWSIEAFYRLFPGPELTPLSPVVHPNYSPERECIDSSSEDMISIPSFSSLKVNSEDDSNNNGGAELVGGHDGDEHDSDGHDSDGHDSGKELGSPTPRRVLPLLQIDTNASGSTFESFPEDRAAWAYFNSHRPPQEIDPLGLPHLPISASASQLASHSNENSQNSPGVPRLMTGFSLPRLSQTASRLMHAATHGTAALGLDYSAWPTSTPRQPGLVPGLQRSISEAGTSHARPSPFAPQPQLHEVTSGDDKPGRVLGSPVSGTFGRPGSTYLNGNGSSNLGAFGAGLNPSASTHRASASASAPVPPATGDSTPSPPRSPVATQTIYTYGLPLDASGERAQNGLGHGSIGSHNAPSPRTLQIPISASAMLYQHTKPVCGPDDLASAAAVVRAFGLSTSPGGPFAALAGITARPPGGAGGTANGAADAGTGGYPHAHSNASASAAVAAARVSSTQSMPRPTSLPPSQQQHPQHQQSARHASLPQFSAAPAPAPGPAPGSTPTPTSGQAQGLVQARDRRSVTSPDDISRSATPRASSFQLPRLSSGIVIRDPDTGEVKSFVRPERTSSVNQQRKSMGSGSDGSGSRGGSDGSGSGSGGSSSMNRESYEGSEYDSSNSGVKLDPQLGPVSKNQEQAPNTREQKAQEMKDAVLRSLRGETGKGGDVKH